MISETKTLPILYSFRRCPYAIRARLAIAYSNSPVLLREVVLRDKPEEMVVLSPKGTVPVLVFSTQKVIDESIEIIHWALSNNDPEGWWKDLSLHEREFANELIEENDGEFKYYLDRYKYADRYPEHPEEHYRQCASLFLDKLESRLTNNTFLLRDNISIADIAIFPFIRQFCFVDRAWFESSSYAGLQRWLNNLLESGLFHSVMKKYPQWLPSHSEVLFPEK